MKYSDAQMRVKDEVICENPADVTAGVTDNEMAVIIQAGEYDAAYTADEAREFANGIQCCHDQRGWGDDVEDVVEYIHDLADLVDDLKTAEEVSEKWDVEI